MALSDVVDVSTAKLLQSEVSDGVIAPVQAKAAKLGEFNPEDTHIYEVAISESKVGTPKIVSGEYITHYLYEVVLTEPADSRMARLIS